MLDLTPLNHLWQKPIALEKGRGQRKGTKGGGGGGEKKGREKGVKKLLK